jgi:hypothetical protein
VTRSPTACEAPSTVSPTCDPNTLTWRCADGSHRYARATASAGTCLPFAGSPGLLQNIGGSLPSVPLDDGRCLWVADSVRTSTGERVENVGLVPDLTIPFGACPSQATFVNGKLESIVRIEDGDDPSLLVQISGAFRLRGALRVLYRLFRRDPAETFGLVVLGSGLGRWDPVQGRILVGGVSTLRFSAELNLGNASLVDDNYAYVWGCSGPGVEFLTAGCVVGRLDQDSSMQLFAGGNRWVSSQNRSDGAITFDDGPWISSVLHDPTENRLLHLYTVGFATSVGSHSAPRLEGPWGGLGTLRQCDLPGESGAYCQGPAVHPELSDPTESRELVVSLRTGNISGAEYWTRLTWVKAR